MAITNSPTVSNQRLRGQFNKKGFTPEDDQGEGSVGDIPEDIRKAVHRVIADLKGRADSIEEDAEAVLADAFSRAILAERRRAVEDVLGMLCCHELYQYRPKAFKGFVEYARTELVQHPSLPSSLPEREQA